MIWIPLVFAKGRVARCWQEPYVYSTKAFGVIYKG